jgi:hypothetical protein
MALSPRVNKFREIHTASTGEDATSGVKLLVAAGDVPADKILTVVDFRSNASAAQVFQLRSSGGTVLHTIRIVQLGGNNKGGNGGGLPMFACPAGEGLDVDFANAVAGSLFSVTIELVDA